jgi:CRP/FNR family cyclic AMP-dependent transcriptional regulator
LRPAKPEPGCAGGKSCSRREILNGKIELRVLSQQAKEAVLAILAVGDFFGAACLAGQPLRMATAAAATNSSVMRLEKSAIIRVLHDESEFSALFMALLTRNIRIEEDLVDQLFNSSEKRLARLLLLLAPTSGRKGNPSR